MSLRRIGISYRDPSEEKERGEIWLEEGLEEDAENRDGVEELDDNEEEGRIV